MHIHIPDGVLPVWLWLSGYGISLGLLLLLSFKLKNDWKSLPKVSMISALMLISMSIPLGIPTHINLSTLSGILLGPYWSLVSSFVVNLLLASMGHGGITIVGLNTIVVWSEALASYFLFSFFKKLMKNYFVISSISSFIALTLSIGLVVSIVAISNVNPAEFLHHHVHQTKERISVITFASIVTPIGLYGAFIESIITGMIVSYIRRTKPNLLP
ncbi:MAG: energy-coupling factor ABC transporter permease [Candidatus Aenigmarchaeota archaeon]|nr:energy-coupling factor ABC transporter permease [Candidatus Aenigmarchaeota archaeon]